jgi:hypothetical protein
MSIPLSQRVANHPGFYEYRITIHFRSPHGIRLTKQPRFRPALAATAGP